MPEDVAFFVAKNVRANVRELEGALRKVLAYSRFSHKDINIGLAREALKDLLSIQNRQISVENIQKTVADFYKIKVADMYSKKRPASIARPRQIAMYLAKDMTKKSLPEIGELFGGRDHTTVLHAVRKIGERAHPQHRAQPAAARAGTDAQGLSRPAGSARAETPDGTPAAALADTGPGHKPVDKIRHKRPVVHSPGGRPALSPRRRRRAFHPQGWPRKGLTEKAKIALSPESPAALLPLPVLK
jgi:hypothetical protein